MPLPTDIPMPRAGLGALAVPLVLLLEKVGLFPGATGWVDAAVTGQAIIGYVIVRGDVTASPELGEELRRHVADKIGPTARPRTIVFTEELPKTRSGKIMRRLLRDVAEGRSLGDTTTLADPSVVDEIRERAQRPSQDD